MGSDFTITSYGGATTVTGSCHLLETPGARVVVDCGAFQGSKELFALNRAPLGFDASELDAVLLTHAHLDHVGRLPLLPMHGYDGPILCRPATRQLAEHLLLDAAKLQAEDVKRAERRRRTADPPLFGEREVHRVLELMTPIEYGTPFDAAGLPVTAQPAGHVPGSASFLVEAAGARLVFSGDLGNARKDVMPDPTPCPPADLVLIESTYGDRDHRDFHATIDEFASALNDAHRRRGKILIPSFALERTQDVLFHLARLEDEGRIEPLPVYVDSPLAARVETVYDACLDELSDEVRAVADGGRDPFAPRQLSYTHSVEDSKAIDAAIEPAVVIAGSGMMSGGRILHHLRAHLDNPHTTVLIVGFQPRGGLGRLLVDGARSVRMFGEQIEVAASVITIGGLSAHADRTELLDWSSTAGADASFRVVHGEPTALDALAGALRDRGQQAEVQPSAVALPDHGRKDEGGE